MPAERTAPRPSVGDSCRAQAELCSMRKLPHFAPHDGVCWSCRRQIYELVDGRSYVTGCPFCNRSYCN